MIHYYWQMEIVPGCYPNIIIIRYNDEDPEEEETYRFSLTEIIDTIQDTEKDRIQLEKMLHICGKM